MAEVVPGAPLLPARWWLGGRVNADSVPGVVLQVLPPLAAIGCFVVPFGSVRRIQEAKSTLKLPALPFLSMATQCAIWLGYGLLLESRPIIVPNIIGFMLGVWYTHVFHSYFRGNLKHLQQLYAGCACILGGLGLFMFVLDEGSAKTLLGVVAASGSVVFSASPLAAIFTVIRSQTTDAMPLQTSLMLFCNGWLWAAFGLLVADNAAIWVPNLLGGIAGTLQLLIHTYFLFFVGPKAADDEIK